jgi:hypothetical protein
MSQGLEAKKQEVVLTLSDVQNIRDFFKHFKVEATPELEDVIARWEAKKGKVDIGDQHDFKVALCTAMMTSEHEMFKDSLFDAIRANSAKIVFDATFKKELENTLTKEEDK